MLEFARIEVGGGPVLACGRCTRPAPVGVASAADITARVASAIDGWASPPGPNIALVGGDVAARADAWEIVSACARAGAQRVAIETCGTGLEDAEQAASAVRAGVTHLWVRLLAGDAVSGDTLAGRRVTASAIAGAHAFRAAADAARRVVAITAVVPVCQHNLMLLPGTVAALAGNGFDAVLLESPGAIGQNTAIYAAAACDTGMVNQLWVEAAKDIPLPPTHALHRSRIGGDV